MVILNIVEEKVVMCLVRLCVWYLVFLKIVCGLNTSAI